MANSKTLLVGIAIAASSTLSCSYSDQEPIAPTRFLPIEGAYNIRDLGGYKTEDGKVVKYHTIFRSGDLNHLTDKDLKYFSSIPLKTIIDFRSLSEVSIAPDKKPSSVVNQFPIPIESGNFNDFLSITFETASDFLVAGNKQFVRDNQKEYQQFFQILMDEKKSPLLFHCSAGKDRAGFAAALFLSSLGVDRNTIFQDYLLSNKGLEGKYTAIIKSLPAVAPLLEAHEEYIHAAFKVIDEEYGGVENYLTNYLNVDINRMKQLYLE